MPADTKQQRCPTPRKGQFQGQGNGYTVIDEVPCARWQCTFCGTRKAWKLRKRIEASSYNKFATLTHKPSPTDTPEAALRAMRHDWHTLHKALNRLTPTKPIKYVAIVEWTRHGAPHLHILMDAPYIPQRRLSAMWKRIHGAPIVDIRRVKSDTTAARYIAKYLTKQNETPYRMRRWSATRGFLPSLPPYINPNYTEEITWSYSNLDPIRTATYAESIGATILESPSGGLVLVWPPGTTDTDIYYTTHFTGGSG